MPGGPRTECRVLYRWALGFFFSRITWRVGFFAEAGCLVLGAKVNVVKILVFGSLLPLENGDERSWSIAVSLLVVRTGQGWRFERYGHEISAIMGLHKLACFET